MVPPRELSRVVEDKAYNKRTSKADRSKARPATVSPLAANA